MIVSLDTSTPICRLSIGNNGTIETIEWEAGRGLAKGLLAFLEENLHNQHKTWQDVTGLAVFKGPGSFTGLRIGITVMNTLAQSLSVPIVGEVGGDWIGRATSRLEAGEDDRLVLPEYGGEAHITAPKK